MVPVTTGEFRHDVDYEVGLRLPDGTEVWPPDTWHDHPLVSDEDRRTILTAIAASATKLGMDAAELVSRYRWVVREKHSYTTVVLVDGHDTDLDDPALVPPVAEAAPVNGQVPEVART